jgi:hypothetical protein
MLRRRARRPTLDVGACADAIDRVGWRWRGRLAARGREADGGATPAARGCERWVEGPGRERGEEEAGGGETGGGRHRGRRVKLEAGRRERTRLKWLRGPARADRVGLTYEGEGAALVD